MTNRRRRHDRLFTVALKRNEKIQFLSTHQSQIQTSDEVTIALLKHSL